MPDTLEHLGRRGFLGGVGAAVAGAAGIAIAKVPDGIGHGAGPHPLPASAGADVGVNAGVGAGAGGTAETTNAGSAGGAGSIDALERAGVRSGAVFGACSVTGVTAKDDGAVAVALADGSGRSFELELLGHDPHTPGVARGGSLAVYLNNQGRGVTATVEEHGLAAMALAAHLTRREADGVELPALPTLTDRLTGHLPSRAV
ncbi:MAG TPA: hypothetical protein VIY73_27450 [Polyangiaceae bacterium]